MTNINMSIPMNFRSGLIAILLLTFIVLFSDNTNAQRLTENINREWKFKLGDHPGAESISYIDTDWDRIGLPHSFSMPYFMSPDFYVGYGWYRKTLNIPEKYIGKRIFVEFEAAFQDAEIFLNGKKTGYHKGGYTGFSIDITNNVKAGDNLLAVRLNNLWKADLMPRAGEHVFSGGIYRDVYLVVTDPVHIVWYGTFVTTPQVSKTSADVNIKTEVVNSSSVTKDIWVETIIYDPNGKKVASQTINQIIPEHTVNIFDQTINAIKNPGLWHPDHPYLYKAISNIYDGKRLVDRKETVFGIRRLEWTADKGFFLNGEHYYIRGVNAHQDHAGWGDAVTNAGFYRDIQQIKDAGFNFVRGSHYPHDPAFSKACDEIGLLLWQENAFWGIGGTSKTDGYWNSSAYPIFEEDRMTFEASAGQQLKEMIRIHRNHPAIICWSMSNEPFFSAPEVIDPISKLLQRLIDLAHQEDPSRLAAVGGCQRPLGETRIDRIGDIAGYNGDGAIIEEFQQPGIPSLVSEYGSVTSVRPGKYDPCWSDLAKSKMQNGLPWRSGQAIWCCFDHGSIAGANLGRMGIVDYFRIPKRAWYWYRNEYKGIAPPVWPEPGIPAGLKLEADKTSGVLTDGTDDVKLTVTVLDIVGKQISNSPEVTLTIVSGPGEFPTGSSITFNVKSDITILDGIAAIEFRSYYAGQTVIRATSPGLKPAEIKINFTGKYPYKESVTPKVKDRPYVRFSKKGQASVPQTYGYNNPTFPSSSELPYIGGMATDGDKKTWWQPESTDPNPAWILDTEKLLSFSGIKMFFPEAVNHKYKVEVSNNRTDWKTVADLTSNEKQEDQKHIILPASAKGRFVRISFNNDNNIIPRIAEVEVTGTVVDAVD